MHRLHALRAASLTCLLASLAFGMPAAAQPVQELSIEGVREAVEAAPPGHPRLLATDTTFAALRQRVATDPAAQRLYGAMLRQAEALLGVEPVERTLIGRRLLRTSRKVVRRVLTLALAYRLTDDARFLERARTELLAAAAFSDWNPSHFLDTAEMSFGLAVGYDWLHGALAPDDRAAIRQALLDKGIGASFEHTRWVRSTNNWGQVCHAGITAAALALMDDEPELAARVVHRAVENVPQSMQVYAPDGSYPEGPGYWAYGTSYNVILIDELETALGTDFGLSNQEGFNQTAAYINHATGPTLRYFNYADGGDDRSPLPALHWFADRYDRPDWLLFEWPILDAFLDSEDLMDVEGHNDRFLPLTLLWMPEETVPAPIRMGMHWRAEGTIPVAMHRTSWTDADALFVGLKAGTADYHHGQMDAGAFVLDALGVRWAADLGAESYHRIESRGMNLWGREQDSDRWTVFRNNNLAHSTLTIGGQHHHAAGFAEIVQHAEGADFPHTIADLSPVFEGQAERVRRGVGVLGGREVIVQDRVEGAEEPVRWGMVTRADVEIRSPREAVLRRDGQVLLLQVAEPATAELRLYDVETPPAEHDSPNPGARMVGFEVPPGGEPLDLVVRLLPGAEHSNGDLAVLPLEAW